MNGRGGEKEEERKEGEKGEDRWRREGGGRIQYEERRNKTKEEKITTRKQRYTIRKRI